MKLILISNSTNVENETEIVTQLFEAGLQHFHLRKTKMSTKKMIEYLKKIPKHFHDRISIHSHFNLALRFNLKGIHLTSNHKKKKLNTLFWIKSIKIKKPKSQVSTSYRSLSQLYNETENSKYNYIFLSPIFDSLTGKYQSGFSEYSLQVALKKINHKVIARGGVTTENIFKAKEMGFEGVAFKSSIWLSKDPVSEFNKVINKFQELKIPIE